MSNLLDKLASLADELETERGRLVLFGLFGREESLGNWDLVVAAPWLNRQDHETVNYLFSKLQGALTRDELLQLSRVVILSPQDQFVQSLRGIRVREGSMRVRGHVRVRGQMRIGDGRVEWTNSEIDGTAFERVVIFVYDPGGELLVRAQGTPSYEERRRLAANTLPALQRTLQLARRAEGRVSRTLIDASLRDALRQIVLVGDEPVLAPAIDASIRVVDASLTEQIEVADLAAIQDALQAFLQ